MNVVRLRKVHGREKWKLNQRVVGVRLRGVFNVEVRTGHLLVGNLGL